MIQHHDGQHCYLIPYESSVKSSQLNTSFAGKNNVERTVVHTLISIPTTTSLATRPKLHIVQC